MAVLLVVASIATTLSCDADADPYPFRFVYVVNYLQSDGDVVTIHDLMQRAAASGYNAIVLQANFDRIALQTPAFLDRLEAVRALQDETGILVIPQVFSAGYGQLLLENDRNLAAAVPVRDQPFVADGGTARLASDHEVSITNGGFERSSTDRAEGMRFQDRPGETTFLDRDVARSGHASMRFENFDGGQRRYGRAMYRIAVRPFRSYRFSLWLKTESLPKGSFLAQVLTDDERVLAIHTPPVEADSDWQRVVIGFNSLSHDNVSIYAGVWSAATGRFWIDDVDIEEVGLVNVVRRPGTPVAVRGADGREYREGADYRRVTDPKLDFTFAHDGPVIELLDGGSIQPGETVHVSYYQALAIRRGQMGVCLSEPAVFELYEGVIDRLERHLRPTHYFIGADEIRHGGWCHACEQRGVTTGEIIGRAVEKQVGIIRSQNANAEIFMWSDMFDPHSNAHDHFYLTKGDLGGSWEHLPKDIIAVVWEPRAREVSLRHFDNLGMRVVVSTYADRGGVQDLLQWMAGLATCEQGVGAMYTTWRRDYSQLEAFGSEINRE